MIILATKMTRALGSAILSSGTLPSAGPFPTMDPFLFCVYHKDQYPPGNDVLEAPRRGNGQDFDPSSAYRMYHGESIPGFPQHPHRGFETITATIDGIIDHADSVGNAGRYGQGDVQWMTAGAGVCHSEMFPLVDATRDNPTRFFQIWLNLPARAKMVDPSFAMFWAENVPKWNSPDGKVAVTVWAGQDYFQVDKNNAPPPHSWASDAGNDVSILHMTIQPGGTFTLPKAKAGKHVNRSLFYIEGASGILVDGQSVPAKSVLTMDATFNVEIELPASVASENGQFLLLQGKPISEPVAQHGPFVMNTQREIEQAFADYRRTLFGGWPWPRDDMVFPSDKGRFALLGGTETTPPIDETKSEL
jgi:quercetin 2,3-dioxygenase